LHKENQSLKCSIESINDEIIHLKENALLKENEMMYLIEQEKRIQDEYALLQDTLRLKDEEREAVMKSMKDEMNWLQTQVDDLSPKAEELTNACNEIELLKETITKEASFQRELQNQLFVLETKAAEKENVNMDLQGHCKVLEARLEDMMANRENMDELNTSFKEMEELYSSKGEELSQVNECLATREVQLEDLRKELMEQKSTCEELQGLLQDRDAENRQIHSLIDKERSTVREKESLVTELLNEVNKEKGNVALLNEKLNEVNYTIEKSKVDNNADIQRKNSEIENANAELKLSKEQNNYFVCFIKYSTESIFMYL
jgi:chromosome segregation ATPase